MEGAIFLTKSLLDKRVIVGGCNHTWQRLQPRYESMQRPWSPLTPEYFLKLAFKVRATRIKLQAGCHFD
jgi:hypothetical protein